MMVDERLGQPYQLEGHTVESSASIGIGLYPENGTDAGTLLRHADVAMYYAKQDGQGRHRFFKEGMEEKATR